MKTKFLHLLALSVFLQLAFLVSARAQDGIPNPELNTIYPESNSYDEKPLLFENELKNPRIIRDTTSQVKNNSTQPASNLKTKGANAATQESKKGTVNRGDDPLNFNFLYYIIQKFKTSDLIDE
jgi:hypothetical protein